MRTVGLGILLAVLACNDARERGPVEPCASSIHACGIQDPDSPEFHGALLRDVGWELELCAGCHGDDFAGGASGASCRGCHAEGPTACVTCHGESPSSGAHTTHLAGGALERRTDCSTCHPVPSQWDDPGHIRRDGAADPAPAEVVFAAVAGAAPTYDPATGQCSGVACHGAALADPAASAPAPIWTGGPSQGACGSCHGSPPASHADDRCEGCHRPVAAAGGELVRLDLHLDGALQVGRACTDCHGGAAAGAAPAPDLAGATSTDEITVGAHAVHVNAEHRLRGPIPCTDCHVQPEEVDDPGHIDSAGPAELFTDAVGFAGLASAAGADPVWDRPAATCADVYCHGGGERQADDTATGLRRTPRWTALDQGEAACGSCHGLPPIDGDHAPDLELADCAGCHPRTVDGSGNILVTTDPVPTSEHIDGTIDL